jgi:hypothetical protein
VLKFIEIAMNEITMVMIIVTLSLMSVPSVCRAAASSPPTHTPDDGRNTHTPQPELSAQQSDHLQDPPHPQKQKQDHLPPPPNEPPRLQPPE